MTTLEAARHFHKMALDQADEIHSEIQQLKRKHEAKLSEAQMMHSMILDLEERASNP